VLDEKCFFFLEVEVAKVACRNLTCFKLLLRTFKATLLKEEPHKFKTFSNTFGYAVIFDVRKTKAEKTMGLTELLIFCRGWT